jgi:hypothetical protein
MLKNWRLHDKIAVQGRIPITMEQIECIKMPQSIDFKSNAGLCIHSGFHATLHLP